MRMFFTAIVRHRIDAEAKRLQLRYAAKKIDRDARHDIFVVADFDGGAVSQLGRPFQSSGFHVLAFSRNGELLHQWDIVPSAVELAAVLK